MNRKVERSEIRHGRIVVGIDEAGRGPLAGPMIVAGVAGIRPRFLRGIRDSKQLTPKAREAWYALLMEHGICKYITISHTMIDKRRLGFASRYAVAQLLQKFNPTPREVLLDGGLFAPATYHQQTIIKGDEKIPLIAAASIIAKVTRDRMMIRFDRKYPRYGFAQHKGYGTLAHRRAIEKHGLSQIHRKSFCRNIILVA